MRKTKNVDFVDVLENLISKAEKHAANTACIKWFLDNFNEGYSKTIDKLMGAGAKHFQVYVYGTQRSSNSNLNGLNIFDLAIQVDRHCIDIIK